MDHNARLSLKDHRHHDLLDAGRYEGKVGEGVKVGDGGKEGWGEGGGRG